MTVLALAAAALALSATPASAQWSRGSARMFVADNTPSSPALIVVNLPNGTVSQRIQMPGTSLQMGLTGGHRHLGVFRNRDNDQQFFTVINTGIFPVIPFGGPEAVPPPLLQAGELGMLRPASVAKSLLVVNGSDGIGGVEYGQDLVWHDGWRMHLLYAESHGLIFGYSHTSLSAASAFNTSARIQLPVGHFHVLPYGQRHVWAPHTGAHAAILVNRSRVVRNYTCGACHGSGAFEQPGKGMAAVFGCNTSVMVVRNTEPEPFHLSTVGGPRVGSFVQGAPGVFWSTSAAMRYFWRTDVRAVPVSGKQAASLSNVTHRGGAVRLLGLPLVRSAFLALHLDGNLTMYDGVWGLPLANLQLRPGGYANQTAPALQFDDNGRTVYVAVTAAGLVHHISVSYSATPPTMELVRTLAVGGMPTAVVVAHVPAVVSSSGMA